MLGAVAAEIAQRCEVHAVGDLRERQTIIIKIFFQDRHRMAVDETADAVAGDALDGGGEVLRRHMQPLGVVAHLALGAADARREQVHQLLDDIGRAVAVRIYGLAQRVRLEDVVHHRQAEASHQLAVEQQLAVVHAVAQAVEVGEQNGGLSIGEFDDGVLIERDAAPDAVVVRRQLVLQELVVGGEPLHLHSGGGGQVLCPVGAHHHHEVVLNNMVALLVEHEAALARRAEQVHTGMAQLWRVHRQEIGGILEVGFHDAKIQNLSTTG